MRDGWAAAALAATLTRIVAVPVILVLLASPAPLARTAAAAVFAGAALTDALDGFLARRGAATTPLGAVLDLTADKLLVCVVLIDLAARQLAPAGVVMVIVARELIVAGLRAYTGLSGVAQHRSHDGSRRVPPSGRARGIPLGGGIDVHPAGKLKMVVTGLAIPVAILQLPGAAWLLVLAAVLTVASAWPYLAPAAVALKGEPGTPAHPPGL